MFHKYFLHFNGESVFVGSVSIKQCSHVLKCVLMTVGHITVKQMQFPMPHSGTYEWYHIVLPRVHWAGPSPPPPPPPSFPLSGGILQLFQPGPARPGPGHRQPACEQLCVFRLYVEPLLFYFRDCPTFWAGSVHCLRHMLPLWSLF